MTPVIIIILILVFFYEIKSELKFQRFFLEELKEVKSRIFSLRNRLKKIDKKISDISYKGDTSKLRHFKKKIQKKIEREERLEKRYKNIESKLLEDGIISRIYKENSTNIFDYKNIKSAVFVVLTIVATIILSMIIYIRYKLFLGIKLIILNQEEIFSILSKSLELIVLMFISTIFVSVILYSLRNYLIKRKMKKSEQIYYFSGININLISVVIILINLSIILDLNEGNFPFILTTGKIIFLILIFAYLLQELFWYWKKKGSKFQIICLLISSMFFIVYTMLVIPMKEESITITKKDKNEIKGILLSETSNEFKLITVDSNGFTEEKINRNEIEKIDIHNNEIIFSMPLCKNNEKRICMQVMKKEKRENKVIIVLDLSNILFNEKKDERIKIFGFDNKKNDKLNKLQIKMFNYKTRKFEKIKIRYLENYENKSNENIIYFSNTGYLEVELVKDYKNYEKWIEAILEKK
jgi:membrane protein